MTAIASKTMGAAAKAADGIIQRLLGPAADEVGEILADKVKAYRAKNLKVVLDMTYTMLDASNEDVQPVPTRLLLPVIEGASLEDDAALSIKWAGLLATAASAHGETLVHPSFPGILSELTAREAAIIDSLLKEGGEAAWQDFRDRAMKVHNCSQDAIDACHGNLFRLGLWRNSAGKGNKNTVRISPFGRTFLRAANGPKVAT